MNLERVIAALAPTDVVQRAPVEISDLAYDTRAVGPGALFFCVPGERHDGHTFAREAVERGAVALVVERVLELDVPQLVVPDARRGMAQAAVVFFDDPTSRPITPLSRRVRRVTSNSRSASCSDTAWRRIVRRRVGSLPF